MNDRLAGGRVLPDGKIAPQSLAAIRSAMDAQMVREIAKLNNLMVFLTIAISGGPFVGLLGTVVGVMITFAAIAAAGDVNVNSIAPGISAALLATAPACSSRSRRCSATITSRHVSKTVDLGNGRVRR